mmetsp:Transcript_52163/g.86518  ORF Transcript_52163/g.86518 Transcript_52163/m.86518 type:complete len:265 (-) Transcript_52163:2464-3258(-)
MSGRGSDCSLFVRFWASGCERQLVQHDGVGADASSKCGQGKTRHESCTSRFGGGIDHSNGSGKVALLTAKGLRSNGATKWNVSSCGDWRLSRLSIVVFNIERSCASSLRGCTKGFASSVSPMVAMRDRSGELQTPTAARSDLICHQGTSSKHAASRTTSSNGSSTVKSIACIPLNLTYCQPLGLCLRASPSSATVLIALSAAPLTAPAFHMQTRGGTPYMTVALFTSSLSGVTHRIKTMPSFSTPEQMAKAPTRQRSPSATSRN